MLTINKPVENDNKTKNATNFKIKIQTQSDKPPVEFNLMQKNETNKKVHTKKLVLKKIEMPSKKKPTKVEPGKVKLIKIEKLNKTIS